MSGSWDHVYWRFEEAGDGLAAGVDMRRRALGKHLRDVAEIMRAIERHDDNGTVSEAEDEAWAAYEAKVPAFRAEVLQQSIRNAEAALDLLRGAIEQAKEL